MTLGRTPIFKIFVVLVALALPLSTFAQVGKPSGGGASIQWDLSITGQEKVTVTVLTPSGLSFSRDFNNGKNPSFSVSDLGDDLEDGQYNYRLSVSQRVDAGVKKKLEKARAENDEAAIRKLQKEHGLDRALVQSGTFTILNGMIVDPNGVEADANDSASAARGVTTDATASAPAAGGRNWQVRALDQVIPDDLIVQSSTCTGFDCVDGESFGFDTLRLKENNLRIHFEDTSTSAGYPANDWRIVANDSASGGANKFVIEDSTAARNPMTIEAAAPADALYVDSTGNIGFQQNAPGLDLHLTVNDTPALRLEQTNAGGFTAQTWDIGANEANFFIRDLTGGSKLSFRIRPGAPTSSIDIAADGDVGIGTASPAARLHVVDTTASATAMRIQNNQANGNSAIEYLDNAGNIDLFFGVQNSSQTTRLNSLNSNPIVMLTNSTERLRIASTGLVTITGDLTVTGTKNFVMPDPADKDKALYYVALEGPEAGTYFRGTAKTVNGEVTIELPGYFSRITENERMTVQLTAVGKYGQLFVAEKSPEKLVIKVAEGSEDLEFDYLVQGIRKGYLNYEVERANHLNTH
ncbi:MAG TPA: hypothetical protein VHK90_09160 [Thermoanaerobaculia bacterium]|nr:hypothetical protein [Thermoanaerobaculia bacterium]